MPCLCSSSVTTSNMFQVLGWCQVVLNCILASLLRNSWFRGFFLPFLFLSNGKLHILRSVKIVLLLTISSFLIFLSPKVEGITSTLDLILIGISSYLMNDQVESWQALVHFDEKMLCKKISQTLSYLSLVYKSKTMLRKRKRESQTVKINL